MKQLLFITISLTLLLAGFSSCKKDKILTDSSAKVDFSQDSLLFDTVFTTIGSATKNIRVINNHKQKIKIASITLQKGGASQFILNVDGAPGKSFSDIEIAANDSIFIFVQVNVNPTYSNSPLIISDAIVFSVNGNTQNLYLEAWGQDAYYHKPDKAIKFVQGGYLAYTTICNNPTTGVPITNTVITWPNDKPHVIYGWLVIDSSQTLIINAGVKVYLHNNAGLWAYRYGTLKVLGVKGNEVVFQGDRREAELADVPGQWDRIWINEGSVNNIIDYAIIKNGYIGVQAELLGNNFNEPKRLRITNTRIQNMNKWGLYGFAFNIYGENNVIVNCKEYCAAFAIGGNYTFLHSTFANFWTKDSRSLPCVHIDNHTSTQVLPLDTCYFGNCIIDGSLGNELDLDMNTTVPTMLPNHKFSYCFVRSSTTDVTHFLPGNNSNGTTTDFSDKANYDFTLGSSSGAVNMPNAAMADATKVPFDIKGISRTADTKPDAGAYER